jgi:hypothetical protein
LVHALAMSRRAGHCGGLHLLIILGSASVLHFYGDRVPVTWEGYSSERS